MTFFKNSTQLIVYTHACSLLITTHEQKCGLLLVAG